jgi:hypothetical protein
MFRYLERILVKMQYILKISFVSLVVWTTILVSVRLSESTWTKLTLVCGSRKKNHVFYTYRYIFCNTENFQCYPNIRSRYNKVLSSLICFLHYFPWESWRLLVGFGHGFFVVKYFIIFVDLDKFCFDPDPTCQILLVRKLPGINFFKTVYNFFSEKPKKTISGKLPYVPGIGGLFSGSGKKT